MNEELVVLDGVVENEYLARARKEACLEVPLGQREILPDLNAFGARDTLVHEYAWAIPTEEAIRELVEMSPIVEIGAGGGYWARLIEDAGGKVYAYDLDPDPATNHYIRRSWFDVQKGGPEKVLDHRDATLMLCWPDYGGSAAFRAASLHQGDKLVYIGERSGGCTGDIRFHALLGDPDDWTDPDDRSPEPLPEREWMIQHTVPLPQFWGIHDAMYVYERIARCQS